MMASRNAYPEKRVFGTEAVTMFPGASLQTGKAMPLLLMEILYLSR